jgi:hypothetical protein
MATLKKQYVDINDTLRAIKTQIIDGLPFAQKCPEFNTPEQLFYWLKRRTVYKNDPQNVELLQTLPTLLNDNFHGVSGAGDCDCFTIATISLLIANGYKNIFVVLVGRSKKMPVHIYTVCYIKNKRVVLDLTNPKPNQERPYPYTQELPVKYEQWK